MGETGVGKSVVVQAFLDQMTTGDQVAQLVGLGG
jgi:DNA repair ATPase RecN